MQGKKRKLVIVGAAGQQGQEYLRIMPHLRELVDLCAIVDINADRLTKLATQYKVPFFTSVDRAIATMDFDLALITVPHYQHHETSILMLNNQKHVIKEKPFAVTSIQAESLRRSAIENGVHLFTVVQRSHGKLFSLIKDRLPQVGESYSFKYEYYKNFESLTHGWRSDYNLSSGGVVLDMGFHIIDIVLRLFGLPTEIEAHLSYCYPHTLQERLEDSANIILNYPQKNLIGSISLARHHFLKQERLEILGTDGALVITPQNLKVFSRSGQLIENIACEESKEEGVINMFRQYLLNIEDKHYFDQENYFQFSNVCLIEQVYQNIKVVA